eukprot:TRINITY_DN1541_c0_g1_i1.p1 TRINITY_DN1541_c0_g1~~TRINITY_DN1541_c0_g1_i1.p1  ORF type:complete len:184 (-),score=54.69 TRINITY_DN1541_c0_g1_i1:46-597(-)
MFDWLWNVLYALGFWNKRGSLLLLGLDNAGKTTLLSKLKTGTVNAFAPTQRPQMESLHIGPCVFNTFDLGGHDMVRDMWREYYASTDAIVFVVDAADQRRLPEARNEFFMLMQETASKHTPVAVLGNKCDLWDKAMSAEDFIREMGLASYLKDGDPRSTKVFMTSLVQGTGYLEALQWLAGCL